MDFRNEFVPLTQFQSHIAQLLSQNRSEDSHLAGGAALHVLPQSLRYSLDLDYFHDSEKRVASAFQADSKILKNNKINIEIEMNQPGYIRCVVSHKNDSTKIEWAKDSTWRFMPVQFDPKLGYVLHPIDLAVNKLLALVGRDEARDFVDVHYTHENILPLGAQCWAACGKDPGFNPVSLLEILKRRGKYHHEDFKRLNLNKPLDLQILKKDWLKMLEEAEQFVKLAPFDEVGCLYFSKKTKNFFQPKDFSKNKDRVPHYGRPGGVLPKIY